MPPAMHAGGSGSSGGGDHEGGQTLFKSTAAPGSYLCADQNGIKVSDVDCGNSTALKFGSYRSVGTLCLGQEWTYSGCREFNWSSDSSCHSGAEYSFATVSQNVTAMCSLRINREGMDMNIGFDGSVFTLQEIQTN